MIIKLVLVCSLLASPALASAVKGYAAETKGGQQRYQETKGSSERHYESKGAGERQWAVQAPAGHFEESHQQQQQQAKGGLPERASKTSPAIERHEQQQLPTKTAPQQFERIEQQQQLQQQQVEELHQFQQQREEQLPTKSIKSASSAADDYGKLEQQRLEQQRLDSEKLERQRQEREQRLEQQRLEQQRLEQQRLEAQKLEQQRLEQQRFEQTQQQQLQQQHEEQQTVELQRDLYEQRRFSEEQSFSQIHQQHEEPAPATKGGAPAIKQQPLVAEPEPYAFDYSVEGSSRRESGDTKGVVRGQYTLQAADGSARVVDYVADQNGFRATVSTNEFGTESRSPAGVEVRSSQPEAQDISLRLEGKTREALEAPAPQAAATKGGPAPLVQAPLPEPPKRPDNWSVKQAPFNVAAPVPAPQPIQQLQQQQQQLLTVEEAPPRAIRGKTIEEARVAPPSLAKGQKIEAQLAEKELAQQREEPLPQQQIYQEQANRADLAKGELRAPKAFSGGELKRIHADEPEKLRSAGFESATAHRAYSVAHSPAQAHRAALHQAPVQHLVPARSYTRPAVAAAAPLPPAAPVHQRQPTAPARAYERYSQPASTGPLAQLVRRPSQQEPAARGPSFYGSADDTADSFE